MSIFQNILVNKLLNVYQTEYIFMKYITYCNLRVICGVCSGFNVWERNEYKKNMLISLILFVGEYRLSCELYLSLPRNIKIWYM